MRSLRWAVNLPDLSFQSIIQGARRARASSSSARCTATRLRHARDRARVGEIDAGTLRLSWADQPGGAKPLAYAERRRSGEANETAMLPHAAPRDTRTTSPPACPCWAATVLPTCTRPGRRDSVRLSPPTTPSDRAIRAGARRRSWRSTRRERAVDGWLGTYAKGMARSAARRVDEARALGHITRYGSARRVQAPVAAAR